MILRLLVALRVPEFQHQTARYPELSRPRSFIRRARFAIDGLLKVNLVPWALSVRYGVLGCDPTYPCPSRVADLSFKVHQWSD